MISPPPDPAPERENDHMMQVGDKEKKGEGEGEKEGEGKGERERGREGKKRRFPGINILDRARDRRKKTTLRSDPAHHSVVVESSIEIVDLTTEPAPASTSKRSSELFPTQGDFPKGPPVPPEFFDLGVNGRGRVGEAVGGLDAGGGVESHDLSEMLAEALAAPIRSGLTVGTHGRDSRSPQAKEHLDRVAQNMKISIKRLYKRLCQACLIPDTGLYIGLRCPRTTHKLGWINPIERKSFLAKCVYICKEITLGKIFYETEKEKVNGGPEYGHSLKEVSEGLTDGHEQYEYVYNIAFTGSRAAEAAAAVAIKTEAAAGYGSNGVPVPLLTYAKTRKKNVSGFSNLPPKKKDERRWMTKSEFYDEKEGQVRILARCVDKVTALMLEALLQAYCCLRGMKLACRVPRFTNDAFADTLNKIYSRRGEIDRRGENDSKTKYRYIVFVSRMKANILKERKKVVGNFEVNNLMIMNSNAARMCKCYQQDDGETRYDTRVETKEEAMKRHRKNPLKESRKRQLVCEMKECTCGTAQDLPGYGYLKWMSPTNVSLPIFPCVCASIPNPTLSFHSCSFALADTLSPPSPPYTHARSLLFPPPLVQGFPPELAEMLHALAERPMPTS